MKRNQVKFGPIIVTRKHIGAQHAYLNYLPNGDSYLRSWDTVVAALLAGRFFVSDHSNVGHAFNDGWFDSEHTVTVKQTTNRHIRNYWYEYGRTNVTGVLEYLEAEPMPQEWFDDLEGTLAALTEASFEVGDGHVGSELLITLLDLKHAGQIGAIAERVRQGQIEEAERNRARVEAAIKRSAGRWVEDRRRTAWGRNWYRIVVSSRDDPADYYRATVTEHIGYPASRPTVYECKVEALRDPGKAEGAGAWKHLRTVSNLATLEDACSTGDSTLALHLDPYLPPYSQAPTAKAETTAAETLQVGPTLEDEACSLWITNFALDGKLLGWFYQSQAFAGDGPAYNSTGIVVTAFGQEQGLQQFDDIRLADLDEATRYVCQRIAFPLERVTVIQGTPWQRERIGRRHIARYRLVGNPATTGYWEVEVFEERPSSLHPGTDNEVNIATTNVKLHKQTRNAAERLAYLYGLHTLEAPTPEQQRIEDAEAIIETLLGRKAQ